MNSSSFSGGVAAIVDPEDVSPEDNGAVVLEGLRDAAQAGAPTLASLLAVDKNRDLAIFSDADMRAVEAALLVKGGKHFVKCLATGKDRQAKPEELVRQCWIARLLNHYGYPKERLGIEFPITLGR